MTFTTAMAKQEYHQTSRQNMIVFPFHGVLHEYAIYACGHVKAE